MKQKFYEHLKQNIDYIIDTFISHIGSDFNDLKYSSYSYSYLDYNSLDTTTIRNHNFIIVPFDDHPTPSIILLEIDNDDILALSNQPITFWGAVRQVLLTEIENQLK
jgi:hypothetical protein